MRELGVPLKETPRRKADRAPQIPPGVVVAGIPLTSRGAARLDALCLQFLVAGVIDHPDETPEEVVRREAVEEADCTIQDIVPICDYFVSPGGTSECISLFCGKVDAASVGGVCGLEEEAEDIRVIVVPFPEAIAQLQAGNIRSAAPIIALQWLQLNHDQIRARWGVVS